MRFYGQLALLEAGWMEVEVVVLVERGTRVSMTGDELDLVEIPQSRLQGVEQLEQKAGQWEEPGWH